jgi:GNAT superfamily N-acetyltransferase
MNDSSIRVRSADINDLNTLVGFNRAMAYESENKMLDPAAVVCGVRNALQDANRARYFVAEVDGQVVGQTMVTFEWSDWRNAYFWWIQSVYVAPQYRRRGVFQALYGHIREIAFQCPDVCGLRLYVHRSNRAAAEVYRRLGMTSAEYALFEDEWGRADGDS